ncbi:hypothetical protein ACFL3B_05545 [Gemmatimonadota bacterium]
MRTLCLALLAGVVLFGSVGAQNQPVQQRRQLLEQVIGRLLENGRVQAGLTDEQFGRYREIARRSIASRNEIQSRERALWRALEGQMRPGVAADQDSVTALIDSLVVVPELMVELTQREQSEYAGFLTPVQRAQLMLTHRRFQNNIQQIMQRRLPNRPGQGGRAP